MDLERIHEKEEFLLKLGRKLTLSDVSEMLEARQFLREDDFAYLPRHHQNPWEAITLVSIDFFDDCESVYPDERSFDRLRVSFLPASTPTEEWKEFFVELLELSEGLKAVIEYNGVEIKETALRGIQEEWRMDILEQSGDVPASETVAILIDLEYPRRRV